MAGTAGGGGEVVDVPLQAAERVQTAVIPKHLRGFCCYLQPAYLAVLGLSDSLLNLLTDAIAQLLDLQAIHRKR